MSCSEGSVPDDDGKVNLQVVLCHLRRYSAKVVHDLEVRASTNEEFN
eukprot:CAMPEP_0197691578 /NCGR_PEP_ID=MMETSP1338-20131121/109922_1 /TAXON_ID=43686 ORGANISM="Pelagodinium beii, Strain RCC1491" /NCGR_SAMPLE_ID=MMETSP1338 /ASSEMBLY_ACC=CAM_ASM_000754 /LENGTH=46 /DNA_ID= /DNA_START= /DNA_END= /DNA_ORIENTATION=